MERRTLVFDLGGVLVDWDPRYAMDPEIPHRERLERFAGGDALRALLHDVDRGRTFAEALGDGVARYPEWADELTTFSQRWPDSVRGELPGTADLLRELHAAGAPLFAVSNWPAETFWVARERFAVLEVFADIVVSGEVGLVKPDPRIYRLALERFGRTSEECVFVDDRPANVAAADEAGMTGIRFTDAAALREHPDIAAWLA